MTRNGKKSLKLPNGVKPTSNRESVVTERRFSAVDRQAIKISEKFTIRPDEKAAAVLVRLGRAMSKRAIDREKVFKSASGKSVYAYSIYPKDTTKFVREDFSGQKTNGRLVNGRFRALTGK